MACKDKWHLILPDYRRVADYHARTDINDEDYCLLTPNELISEKLSKAFCIYVKNHKWFGCHPQSNPYMSGSY